MSASNSLTKAVISLLNLNGYKVWRQNNNAVYDQKKGVFRHGGVLRGVPDVIGFHRKTGMFICVEVKTGKDKLSAFQTEFLNDVVLAGATAVVVRSSDDLMILNAKL